MEGDLSGDADKTVTQIMRESHPSIEWEGSLIRLTSSSAYGRHQIWVESSAKYRLVRMKVEKCPETC